MTRLDLNGINLDDKRNARSILADFVTLRAEEVSEKKGFTYFATADAPATYKQLVDAYNMSVADGDMFPVLSEFCENTIYGSEETNMALRFYHDMTHHDSGLSFRMEDEMKLAQIHVGELSDCGVGKLSLPSRMLYADLAGAQLVYHLSGRYIENQEEFIDDAVHNGLMHAVINEIKGGTSSSFLTDESADPALLKLILTGDRNAHEMIMTDSDHEDSTIRQRIARGEQVTDL